jgi:hypothetical protein
MGFFLSFFKRNSNLKKNITKPLTSFKNFQQVYGSRMKSSKFMNDMGGWDKKRVL